MSNTPPRPFPANPPNFPLFTFAVRASVENAQHDKIEIEMGRWGTSVPNREAANHILQGFASPPRLSPTRNTRRDSGNTRGWIFNSAEFAEGDSTKDQEIRSAAYPQKSKSGKITVVAPPLFGGRCSWRLVKYPSSSAADSQWRLSSNFKLTLNPTRFFLHRLFFESSPKAKGKHPVRTSEYLSPQFSEVALDQSDNWIPFGGGRWTRWLHTPAEKLFSKYFSLLERAIRADFKRVERKTGQTFIRENEVYNVKELETYWEWYHPDPLSLLESLVPLLRSYTSKTRMEREYEPFESTHTDSTRILRIQTAVGEWLKIYAKTDHRVRVEVTHNFRKGKNRFVFPREADTQGQIRRISAHTFPSAKGVNLFLSRVRKRATTTVNKLLQHLSEHASFDPSSHAPHTTLFHVARALKDDEEAAERFISLLVHHGAIPAGGGEATREAIKTLRNKGIIVPRGNRSYVPAPCYRDAFHLLMTTAMEWRIPAPASEEQE